MTTAWDRRDGDRSVLNSVSTAGVALDAAVANTIYVLLAVRLVAGHTTAIARPARFSTINEMETHFEWMLLLNPTVAAALVWEPIPGHPDIEVAHGATEHTIADGDWEACPGSGFVRTTVPGGGGEHHDAIEQPIELNEDPFVLAIRPLANNAVMQGTVTIRELL